MKIQLKNIAPHPLIGAFSSLTQIWEKDVVLNTGEKVHVLAPSGTGKSTLLGILYGLRKDFNGDLLFNQKSPSDWSEIRTQSISIVFQELELLNGLTALENIQLKNQLTAHLTDAEIHDLMVKLGVEDLKNKCVEFLSRGERQRIAIIRAMCMPFEWLLLDEPFSALDEQNTKAAIEVINAMLERNKAGLILANLKNDDFFEYQQKLVLA